MKDPKESATEEDLKAIDEEVEGTADLSIRLDSQMLILPLIKLSNRKHLPSNPSLKKSNHL